MDEETTPPKQSEFRFADRELLAELVALLPPHLVYVREGDSQTRSLYVHSLAARMIERALCEGWMIDRTNGDGEIAEWDGWLIIESPKRTFLQIAKAGGKPLEELT